MSTGDGTSDKFLTVAGVDLAGDHGAPQDSATEVHKLHKGAAIGPIAVKNYVLRKQVRQMESHIVPFCIL